MPAHDPSALVPAQMGCYGLGLSRMIAAIAQVSHDKDGIIWPESVAPWECIVIQGKDDEGEEVYDEIASAIGIDNVILDDRAEAGLGRKIGEARGVGYPYIAIVGREWQNSKRIEFTHRQSGNTQLLEISTLKDPSFWNL